MQHFGTSAPWFFVGNEQVRRTSQHVAGRGFVSAPGTTSMASSKRKNKNLLHWVKGLGFRVSGLGRLDLGVAGRCEGLGGGKTVLARVNAEANADVYRCTRRFHGYL